MKKHEYLRQSFLTKRYLEVNWWIRALSDFVETPELPKLPYYLVKQPWGIGVTLPDGSIEKLEDAVPGAPTFNILDKVKVTPEWLPNIKEPLETDFGILTANAVIIAESFGSKIPFINGEVSVSKIEKMIAPKLTSNPPRGENADTSDPSKIYVFEMLSMSKGIELITTVMELFTIALTQKTLLPPPGIKEFKQKLMAENNYDLNDPIQLADFESKLLAFDREYLQGDPSLDKFTSGKILKDSRKKLYLSMGAEGGFTKDNSIVGVPTSLSEGTPRDPQQYVAMINGSRSGSFSRGHETMEGGVAAKKMLAASNNYLIVDTDCGSKMGLERVWAPWLVNSIRGRTIINGNTQTKVGIHDDTGPYLGKTLRVRSPMYCRLKGEEICRVCAGEAMARFGSGIAIPLTEISHAILIARMKAMHTNSLTVKKFDLNTLFS